MKKKPQTIRGDDDIYLIGAKRILDVQNRFDKQSIAALFDASKESLVLLHILRTLSDKEVAIPIFFIDTTVLFQEIYEYVQNLEKQWNIKFTTLGKNFIHKNTHVLPGQEECCRVLKEEPLYNALSEKNINVLLVGNENSEGVQNKFIYQQYLNKKNITVIDITADFTPIEIWNSIKTYKLPYCKTYDSGYKITGCEPCVKVPGIIELKKRSNRFDKADTMSKLKSLGYM